MSSDPAFSSDPAVMSRPDSRWRERHAVLAAGYGGRDDPADPALVLAMPIVLHIPKADPPKRTALLEAAATAAVALCLDERVGFTEDGEPGPWHEDYSAWVGARIRKVSRRARGAQWLAAQEVPGITVDVDGAQARALVPGPVGELDPRIKKLQIGGTDLEHDEPGPPGAWSSCAVDRLGARDDGRQGVGTGRACLDVVGGGHVRETVLGLGAERLSLLSARCEPGTVGRSSSSAEEVGGRRGS